LDFKEFIIGLEGIGIRLKLEDCRLIFETLDYNDQGDIDFSKFCLLNTDRKIDWAKIVSIFFNSKERVRLVPRDFEYSKRQQTSPTKGL